MRLAPTAVFALLVLVLNPGLLPAQQGSIRGVVVATRTDADQRETLLVKTPAVFAGRAVDEVRLRVGRDIARGASASLLPGGWRARADGAELRLAGAAAAGADSLVARFVVPGVSQAVIEALKQARLELFADGDRLARADVPVERRPAVDPDVPLDAVLGLPPVVVAGDTITLKPYDLTLTPYGGAWQIESIDEAAADPEVSEPVADEPAGDGLLDYSFDMKLGTSLGADLKLKVKYTDEWGDVLVEGDAPTLELLPDMPGEGASIAGCTDKSFRGRVFCVCGWFPDEAARSRLTIDGAPLGDPLTSSRRVLYFRLPEEIAPGPHTVALAGADGSASIEVLELSGQIDQDELLRGESTPIHITIAGTRDALSLRLVNHAPGSISLEGGDDQVITTSGGETNSWTGRVQGHTPGNFHLTYELTAGRCPCAELVSTSADLPEGETWYDDTFERFKRGRDLANDARDAELDGDDSAGDLAKEALDELARTREALKKGIESGDIGPESTRLFEEYISRYESQARAVTATPPPVPIEDDEEGDDPRDTPPPVIYGEEIDPPMIVVTDGWVQPSQGVWQDDDDFRDAPGKQLTRTGTAAWRAELKMVAERRTALFGIRDDTGAQKYTRILIKGETTATQLAKVRFRFTLIQGGQRTVVYEQPSARAQNIWLDGPAGTKREWRATIHTETGVPDGTSFTMKPGPYLIEAELIRDDTGKETGLKATVAGEAVTTTAPTLHFMPVALGDTVPAAASVMGARARRLASWTALELPDYLPLAPGGLTTTAQPLREMPEVQPGVLRELVSMLPLADDSDTVRRDRLQASLAAWVTTQAALTGGGKVVALLARDEFNDLWPDDNVGAFASTQKMMVAPDTSSAKTIAHELTHTTPFLWSKNEMIGNFGFSYHNYDDRQYADGVELFPLRMRHDTVRSLMGPVGGQWITQGTYWHLLELFQARPDPPLIVTRGFLAREGGRIHGRLDALYEVMGVPDLETGGLSPSHVAIELRDADGGMLGRFPFKAEWRVPHVERERSIVAFTFTVPDLEGTAEIALVGPDGALLHSRRRSASAPAVEILSPAAGARVTPDDERLRVTWRGSDVDGDDLTYMVLYSPDAGATWRVAGYEVTGTSFDVPIVGRPASPRVRVIATDGARSATAEVSFSYAR